MPAPSSIDEFLDLIRKSGVAEEKRLNPYLERLRASNALPGEPNKLAGMMIRDGILTHFQAEQLLQGKWRRFTIGKYKVLERLGSGGMGSVYLCEHKLMRRRVAVKVLPTAKAAEPSSLERFYREARAVASLDHPNIVHAYDIDQDETLHFLVMEYVDGASLQEIVKRSGPLDPVRAAHYVYQSALGLEHAHASGLVHRDIKPGNLLVDRGGTLKILDMGLARFFNDEEDILTKKYDEHVLGTADYLAPEQAVDSHEADTRADIYSLGATFYFMLTGRTPFEEGTIAQKLIWHQTRQPKPISAYRGDVPPEMLAIIDRMMAKRPEDRYQLPHEVSQALLPWVQQPIAPPKESELPRLSLAAIGNAAETQTGMPPLTGPSSSRKNWHVISSNSAPKLTGPPPSSKPPAAPKTPPTPAPGATKPASPPAPAPSRTAAPSPPPRPNTPPSSTGPTPVPTQAPHLPTIPAQTNNNGLRPGTPVPEKIWSNLTEDSGLTGIGAEPSSPSSSVSRSGRSFVAEPGNRFWQILVVVVSIGVVIVAVLLWSLFVHLFSQTSGIPEKAPLIVKKNGTGDKVFSSILLALRAARPGDVIELWDDRYDENVLITQDKGTSAVTLRAAPGKSIVWTFQKGRENQPLLQLHKAPGFTLQGDRITLDGKGKLTGLVSIYSHCPGLTVSGLQLRGFTKHGIKIINCAGDSKKYVRLEEIQADPSIPENIPLIYFDANPEISPPVNDFIDLRDALSPGTPVKLAIDRKNDRVTGNSIKYPSAFSWE